MGYVGGRDLRFKDENESTKVMKKKQRKGRWFPCRVPRCRVVNRAVETRAIKNMTSIRFPGHKIISIRIPLPALLAGGGAPCFLFLRVLFVAEADL